MIDVLEVLPGDRAIVSTAGYCRVVLQPSGRIINEFVEPRAAKRMASLFNRCRTATTEVAEAVSYEALCQNASS